MKYGLALSGGGEKGAYQVGALKAFYFDLRRRYDVVAGVSIGAVNAAHQAMFAKGDERRAWDELEQLHGDLRTEDLYRSWFPFGLLQVPWKPSIFDSSRTRDLIHRRLRVSAVRASGKELRIGVTSLTRGDYRVYTQNDDPLPDLVYASAAFPVAFSPVRVASEWLSDGGVRTVTPVRACIDAGCTHIDVVMLSPRKVDHLHTDHPTALDVALRALELQADQVVEADLDRALLWNRLIARGETTTKRSIHFLVVRPERALPTRMLQFSPAAAAKLMGIGYEDARAAIKRRSV